MSASSITATSPAGSGVVDITVTTAAGTSATSSADQFTYGITVTGLSPSSGPDSGGTIVNLLGSGFTGATAVQFGSTAATTFTVTSPTSITATSPAGTGTVDVTVTAPIGTSQTNVNDKFSYTPGPPVGIGLVIHTGTGNPAVACTSGGGTCKAPNASTCIMTGSNNNITCDISGVWGPGNNKNNPANVVFYVETVDASGNPVVYSTTSALTIAVTGASTSATPLTIPANASITSPETVTASLTSKSNTTNVTITAGPYTLNVTVEQ